MVACLAHRQSSESVKMPNAPGKFSWSLTRHFPRYSRCVCAPHSSKALRRPMIYFYTDSRKAEHDRFEFQFEPLPFPPSSRVILFRVHTAECAAIGIPFDVKRFVVAAALLTLSVHRLNGVSHDVARSSRRDECALYMIWQDFKRTDGLSYACVCVFVRVSALGVKR